MHVYPCKVEPRRSIKNNQARYVPVAINLTCVRAFVIVFGRIDRILVVVYVCIERPALYLWIEPLGAGTKSVRKFCSSSSFVIVAAVAGKYSALGLGQQSEEHGY